MLSQKARDILKVARTLGVRDPFNKDKVLYHAVCSILNKEYYGKLALHHVAPDVNALLEVARVTKAEAKNVPALFRWMVRDLYAATMEARIEPQTETSQVVMEAMAILGQAMEEC